MKSLCTLLLAMFYFGSGVALADDGPSTTAATDKSGYTLFHPTPVDQMRDMEVDRPDKTNTPDTIDAGHLQIESGFFDLNFSRHGSGRNDPFSLGEEDFRIGVLNNVEVDVAIALYDSLPVPEAGLARIPRHDGIGDLFLGGTYNLWGNDAGDTVWASSLGIQPQFKIPTAAHDIGNGHFEAFIGVPFQINLPSGFHLGAETIVSDERNSSNDGNVTGWQNMIEVDHVFLQKFDIYAEYWSHLTTEQHTKPQQTIDTGITYSITDSIVLDTGFNFGLNSATSDFEWVAGITVRF
jgi:hypothetical protein